jgi:hypothetical protein
VDKNREEPMDSRAETEGGRSKSPIAWILGLILGIIVILAGIYLIQRVSTISWKMYKNEEFSFEIAHAGDWTVTEAIPRDEWDMVWDNPDEDLLGDELAKITFRETGTNWPGMFQIRVLGNPDSLGLEDWLSGYKQPTGTDANMVREVTDTTFAGRPAKRLSMFAFGHEDIEILLDEEGMVLSFFFVGKNPNDPEIDRHNEDYHRMLGSFRFLD